MPLSIQQYRAATQNTPTSEPLTLETDGRIGSRPLPPPTLLTLFGLGAFFETREKQYRIIADFKQALVAKYGKSIANFAFPESARDKACVHGLESGTVATALKKADVISLLRDAIIESMEPKEEEPADSPFVTVPGTGALVFSETTLTAIKEAYRDTQEALTHVSQNVRNNPLSLLTYRSPASQERARQAIIRDLNNREHQPHVSPEEVPIDIAFKALTLAMESSAAVKEEMHDFLRPPVQASAKIPTTAPKILTATPISEPISLGSTRKRTTAGTPLPDATPVPPPQIAIRIDDSEWNI